MTATGDFTCGHMRRQTLDEHLDAYSCCGTFPNR